MRFLSVCSGIEAASVAWNPLGWHAAAFSEIEPFPCAVLAHHYPSVPNWGDMTKFKDWPDATVDLLCGGTPCQSFSVAGLRKGLSDPRGNLMLTYLAIAARYRPQWVVWENVPGVLSSWSGADETGEAHPGQDEWEGDETSDFSCFLAGLTELGYGWAYRSLDAQFAGLAQRRERVFVVGCLGSRARAAAVLFERHSLSGHPAPSRGARAGVAIGTLGGTSPGGGWRVGADEAAAGQLVAYGGGNTAGPIDVTTRLTRHGVRMDFDTETFIAFDTYNQSVSDTAQTLCSRGDTPGGNAHLIPAVAYTPEVAATMVARSSRGGGQTNSPGHQADHELIVQATVGALMTHHSPNGHGAAGVNNQTVAAGHVVPTPSMQVRRLTPRECERLQGFADDYTAVPHRGKPAADGPRYKALGNSWAVPCARWIGERIQQVEALRAQVKEAA